MKRDRVPYDQIHDNNVTTQQNDALSIVKVNFQDAHFKIIIILQLSSTVKDVMVLGRTLIKKNGRDDLTDSEDTSLFDSMTQRNSSEHINIHTVMDSCRGTKWMIFLLLTLLDCTLSCPSGCECGDDGYVNCTGSAIQGMPRKLPQHTYTLNLTFTGMNVINERDLAEQVYLLRFCLTNSHLRTIHPRAFHVAPQLKSVKLSSNDLSALPAHVFSSLTSVEEIFLDGNQLDALAPDLFKGLGALLILDLNHNQISSLSFDIFDGLTNLTYLNLSRNKIKKLPPTIFHSLTKLRVLRLYRNEVEKLEAGIFDKLVSLEELSLFLNKVARLPPQVFWSLRNLMSLTLSSNKLREVPPRTFYNMPNLIKLTVYKNPLMSLPDELMGHMPHMQEFYLYSTDLATVPGNLFANMSGLLQLNLHLNERLRQLPPDLFCCLPKLQKLSLRSNNLNRLHPQLFSKLTTLGTLLLNDNNLTALPEGIFQNLTRLETLDVKNNHLKTLPGDVFTSNTALKHLNMSGNLWDCSCAIRDIVSWMKQNERVIYDNKDVICFRPFYQMLRKLTSLRDEDFDHCFKKSTTTFRSTPVMEQSQPLHVTSVTPPVTSTTSETTTYSATAPSKEAYTASPVFHDILVVQQGPEYVHHNHHNGWVYVWFLPSNRTLVGFFMICYILLVAAGLLLIVAAIYNMYRLSAAMEKLKAECLR